MYTHSTVDLIADLAEATDLELAIAYDNCENIDTIYPLYMIKAEMDQRGINFDYIEGLLNTLTD